MKSKRVATALAFVALNMAHSVMVAMAADPPAHEFEGADNHRIKGGSNNPYPMKTNLRVGLNSHRGLSKSSKASKSAKTPSLISKSSKSCKSSKSISDADVIDFVEDVREANDIQPIIQKFTEALKCLPTCFTGTAADVTEDCATSVAGCCEGDNACEWAGSATICDDACVGDSACYNIPSNAVVMEGSCVGANACQDMGNNSVALSIDPDYVPLFVARGSCAVDEDYTGNPVCALMGTNGKSVVIGSKSCTTDIQDEGAGGSCQSIGELTEGSVLVGSESCTTTSACAGVARSALTADVKIGSGACRGGSNPCTAIGSTSILLESVDIADGSCIGGVACGGMGLNPDLFFTALTSIAVGIGSCLGALACCRFGGLSETISIGDNSCDRDSSCTSFGQEAKNAEVGDGSCTGTDGKCAFFGSIAEGADVTVNSGVCASNAEDCSGDADLACTGTGCAGSFIMVSGGVCTNICTP